MNNTMIEKLDSRGATRLPIAPKWMVNTALAIYGLALPVVVFILGG